MPSPTPPLLRADGISLHGVREDIRAISIAIEPRRFTLLSGQPGSGAGLLLRLLGLLERAEAGELWIDSQPTAPLDDAARLTLRNRTFGYLFAEPFLLDSFTVAENVAMPLFKISGFGIEEARSRTATMLDFAGIVSIADGNVCDLSLLDRHKLSLVRALAIAPQALIAEDACLQLPPHDIAEFTALLRSVPAQLGIAVICTSHAPVDLLAPDREIRLDHGLIAADSHPVSIHEAPAHD
jgi:ABC-type lipoprotein export system ATPase subunit